MYITKFKEVNVCPPLEDVNLAWEEDVNLAWAQEIEEKRRQNNARKNKGKEEEDRRWQSGLTKLAEFIFYPIY